MPHGRRRRYRQGCDLGRELRSFQMLHELRDPADARRYLVQGLWLQRVQGPRAAAIGPVLEWGLELAGAGEALPPLGFIADVGHIALQAATVLGQEGVHVPGWPEGLART